MLLGEGSLVRLVAASADARDTGRQDGIGIGGGVWIMAVQTTLLHRVVLVPVGGDVLAELLMATEAQLATRKTKIVPVLRTVRVVTFRAIPFHNDFVCAPGIVRNDFLMARLADPARVLGKEFSVG